MARRIKRNKDSLKHNATGDIFADSTVSSGYEKGVISFIDLTPSEGF